MSKFKIRDDKNFLDNISRYGLEETIFAGELEDLCQEGNWDEAKILTAKLFLVSDKSRAVMDTLVELALQNPDKNLIFCFHLLRAYQFQESKEDTWAFILCLFNYLSGQKLPKPHKKEKVDIMEFKDIMLHELDPVFFASLIRIWDGDYVRIRGYRRELSHWISLRMNKKKQIISKNTTLSKISSNFINSAEKIISRNGQNIESDLLTLECLRYLNKESNEKSKPYLFYLMNKLLEI